MELTLTSDAVNDFVAGVNIFAFLPCWLVPETAEPAFLDSFSLIPLFGLWEYCSCPPWISAVSSG